jgi:hypothetical protein
MRSRVAMVRGLVTAFVVLVAPVVGAQDKPVGKVTVESKSSGSRRPPRPEMSST